MGEGWENARRRDGGNDQVDGPPGRARGRFGGSRSTRRYFIGNAAGWASLRGIDAAQPTWTTPAPGWSWCRGPGCSPTPGTCSGSPTATPVTHVRLDVFPDGGLARLRVYGAVPPPDRAAGVCRWLDLLPQEHAIQVLATDGGLSQDEAAATAAARPLSGTDRLPEEVVRRLLG